MSSKIHITNLSDLKKTVQLLLNSVRDTIKQSSNAVIQIDLSFPQAYPVTTNPELLGYIIEELLNLGVEEISVIGSSYYNLSAEKIWESLGFNEYISGPFPQVQFIPIDDKSINKSDHEVNSKQVMFPKIVEDAQLFISLVNPKSSLFSDLSLSIERSLFLLDYHDRLILKNEEDTEYCENDLYLKKYKQNVLETHFIRTPDLVLYDFSSILSQAGPNLYSDSIFQYSQLMMVSENSVIGDFVALTLCNKDPSENPLIEALKDYDYSKISQEEMDNYSITLTDIDETGELQEIDLNSILGKKETDQKKSIKFWKKRDKDGENNNVFPKFENIPSFIDIFEVFPQKVEICKGVMCSGCKKAAIELLLMLKTAMVKDQETIPNFSVLLGKNPIEPKHEYCIVFGDHAIETTKERKFRVKKVVKNVRTERELELDRAKLKIKLQKKIVEIESHHDLIIQEVPEGAKRDRSFKKLERKIAFTQRWNKYRLRAYDKYFEQKKKRNQKLMEHENVTVNPHILEIPGCPPDPLGHLDEVITLFRKRWLPGLILWNEFLDPYFVKERIEETDTPKQHEKMEVES